MFVCVWQPATESSIVNFNTRRLHRDPRHQLRPHTDQALGSVFYHLIPYYKFNLRTIQLQLFKWIPSNLILHGGIPLMD